MSTDRPDPDPTPTSADAPPRACRKCAAVSSTSGTFCPQCGTAYERRRRLNWRARSKRTRIIVVATLAVILVGGGGTATALKVSADRAEQRRVEAAERQAAEQRRAVAEREREAQEAAEAEAEAQAAMEKVSRDLRRDLVHGLRKSITADARKRVDEGYLDGPIYSTSCENSDGNEPDLDAENGAYECLAVNEKHDGGQVRGYRFTGRVDYEEGSYTWRLGG